MDVHEGFVLHGLTGEYKMQKKFVVWSAAELIFAKTQDDLCLYFGVNNGRM